MILFGQKRWQFGPMKLQINFSFCLHLKLLLVFWNFDGFWRTFLVFRVVSTKISFDFSFAWFFCVKTGLKLGLWSSKSIMYIRVTWLIWLLSIFDWFSWLWGLVTQKFLMIFHIPETEVSWFLPEVSCFLSILAKSWWKCGPKMEKCL